MRDMLPLLEQVAKMGRPRTGPAPEPAESSTKLGDWYANRLNVGSLRLILCTSDASLLSVVVPAKELNRLPERLVRSLGAVLADLGMAPDAVIEELDEMNVVQIGRTRSRQVLGSMLDLAWQAEARLREEPDMSLHEISLDLAEVPCSPLGYESPGKRARKLLMA